MFNQGDKVVCINAEDPSGLSKHFDQWVQKDKEYTVRRVEGSLFQGTRVLLKEIKNGAINVPALGGKAEPGFSAERFRLVDREVEVAMQKEEELADV